MTGRTSRQQSADPFVVPSDDLATLASAAARCEGCELFLNATQTVFGEGPRGARLMLVGEQPGDREDVEGLPFVGPAGRLLDGALRDADIDREDVYVTNAVKHFRWERDDGGARRLHKKPGRTHVRACQPWLRAELRAVKPVVVVLLGSTAVNAVFGFEQTVAGLRDGDHRLPGEFGDDAPDARAVATIHPSAVLRSPQRAERRTELVADLVRAAQLALR